MVGVSRTKCTVSLAVTRLEGNLPPGIETAVEVRWKQKRGWKFPFLRRKRSIVSISTLKRIGHNGSVDWEIDGEAGRIDNASVSLPDYDSDSDTDSGFSSFSTSRQNSLDVTFSVLYGFENQGKRKETKREVMGKANRSLAEWIRFARLTNRREINDSFCNGEIKRVPITLKKGFMICDAILHVKLQFFEPLAINVAKINPSLSDSSTELELGAANNKNSLFFRIPIQSYVPWRRPQTKSCDSRESENDEIAVSWEKKEIICRQAKTKLKTEIFFASIDQRDETAGGESACTALVALVANSLLSKNLISPTKQQLDELIKDGSSEWRKLCENETLIARFPNKHFDLETIIQANIKPIKVIDEKSFVGFFQPESFESLIGATSFDDIWPEITKEIQEGEMRVYIVSWNDHFFALKIESDAFYIVDTLGERLFEGCKKAYILKFDISSEMYVKVDGRERMVGKGKEECCREFIKRFLAAIPLREELERRNAVPHSRLQIEFHYTVLDEDGSYENGVVREMREIELDRT